jgi:hypothetical protein
MTPRFLFLGKRWSERQDLNRDSVFTPIRERACQAHFYGLECVSLFFRSRTKMNVCATSLSANVSSFLPLALTPQAEQLSSASWRLSLFP